MGTVQPGPSSGTRSCRRAGTASTPLATTATRSEGESAASSSATRPGTRSSSSARARTHPTAVPDAVRPELDRSLELLRTDRVDLCLLHRDDPAVPIGEFADALDARGRRRPGARGRRARTGLRALRGLQRRTPAPTADAQAVVLSNQLSLAEMLEPMWERLPARRRRAGTSGRERRCSPGRPRRAGSSPAGPRTTSCALVALGGEPRTSPALPRRTANRLGARGRDRRAGLAAGSPDVSRLGGDRAARQRRARRLPRVAEIELEAERRVALARRSSSSRSAGRRRAARLPVMDGSRHARPPAPRPADLGHRPLQLPLHLLHAEGGLRPGLPVPAPRPAAVTSRRSRGSRGVFVGSASRRSA